MRERKIRIILLVHFKVLIESNQPLVEIFVINILIDHEGIDKEILFDCREMGDH